MAATHTNACSLLRGGRADDHAIAGAFEIAGGSCRPAQIAQLVLKSLSSTVRVTRRSQVSGQEDAGATCETTAIRLDQSARIAELLLNPVN
jgi:hypothetical protein